MIMRIAPISASLALACALLGVAPAARGDGPLSLAPPALTLDQIAQAASAADASTRYGFLGLLDHRSSYGTFWFPEPLLADEADVDNEVSLSFQHTDKRGHQFETGRVEVEKAFGSLTLEIAGGYEADRSLALNPATSRLDRDTEEGFSNIELGARFPFFQYVSPDRLFDDTFVLGLELSPPSQSKVSKDTEIVPKVFNLLRIGPHLSLQTAVGLSESIGPQARGLGTLEYSLVLGYELDSATVSIPGVLRIVPLAELDGEYTFNQDQTGANALTGVLGVHIDFRTPAFLPAQPRWGIGYMFPIDGGARGDFRWGIVTSLIFEY